jgi:Xaa-Pro dipeptidase
MTDTLAPLYSEHLATVAARTDAALAAEDFDALVVHSGAPRLAFLDDRPVPFIPNPHFRHWVPLVAPQSWLVYEPRRRPRVVFNQPRDYWHAAPTTPDEEWTREVDLIVIDAPEAARAHLPRSGRVAAIGEPGQTPDWSFAALNPPELLHRLHYERAVKTPYEIECMRRANTMGVAGHRAAEQAFRAGASEFEIHLAYLAATRLMENDLPYSNIIALNEHAAVLHYTTLTPARLPESGRLSFLIDAGAQFRGYACDITRTYSAQNGFFRDLVAALDDEQRAIGASVETGVDYVDIHLDTHRRIAHLLRDAGVIRVAAQDAVESGLTSVFFPHGVGHLLGLQVHDIGGFMLDPAGRERARPAGHPYLRLTRKLEPGIVVTIEPGIYFIPMLLEAARANGHAAEIDWDLVSRCLPFGGIRIEDNVVCTADAPENLTRDAFAAAA